MFLSLKKMFVLGLGSLTLLGANLSASAPTSDSETTMEKAKKPSSTNGVLARGSVLPARVFRAYVGMAFKEANAKFDDNSTSQALGGTVNGFGMGFALEYGLTSQLSLQVKIPLALSNTFTAGTDEELLSTPGAQAGIKGAMAAGFDRATAADNVLAAAKKEAQAAEQIPGTTSVGDIEVGALYNWVTNDCIVLSTGLGMRFPSAKYYAPKATRPTGSGLYEIALRNNVDVAFLEKNLWLSFEHQGEISISKARAPIESANPLVLDETQEKYFTRSGLNHKVALETSFSFAALSQHLKFVSTAVSYNYGTGAPTYIDSKEVKARSHVHSINTNVSLTALPYGVPLSFDLDYDAPFAGKNTDANLNTLTMTLKAYLKI